MEDTIMTRIELIRKMAAQTATHLKEKNSYLRASGIDKIERAGIVEAAAELDSALADNDSTEGALGKAIEKALPFCSLWHKGQLLDKFFEIATFSNSESED